jgi:hypothetical protein
LSKFSADSEISVGTWVWDRDPSTRNTAGKPTSKAISTSRAQCQGLPVLSRSNQELVARNSRVSTAMTGSFLLGA